MSYSVSPYVGGPGIKRTIDVKDELVDDFIIRNNGDIEFHMLNVMELDANGIPTNRKIVFEIGEKYQNYDVLYDIINLCRRHKFPISFSAKDNAVTNFEVRGLNSMLVQIPMLPRKRVRTRK